MTSLPESPGFHTDPQDSRYQRYFDGAEWTRRRVLQTEVEPLPEVPFKSDRKIVIVGEPPSIYVTGS